MNVVCTGNIVLPGGWDYRNGSITKNWRFQAKLGAVVYPESTSKNTLLAVPSNCYQLVLLLNHL